MPDARPAPRWRDTVVEALAVAAATVVALAVHLQLWRAAWREPWLRGGDADFYLMVARGLGQHGSYLSNANLGWPFGQHLADLPEGADNLHLAVLRALAVLTRGPASAVNVFFVATFAAVAFSAHLVLRRLRCSRAIAAAGAFVYAFAPYHFIRGEGHLLLSGYEMVPVGVLLALALFDEPLPLLRHDGERGLEMRSGRTWSVVAAAVLLASTGPYYFVFSMMLIGVAGGLHALSARRWRPILAAGLIIVIGVMAFAVNVSPSLLNGFRHGSNPGVAQRSPFETQLYGLKISQLFIPRQGHRIAGVQRVVQRAQGPTAYYRSEAGQQLGLLGAASLVGILLTLALHAVSARPPRWLEAREAAIVRRLGLLAVVAMLVGAIGGLSFLVASVVLPDIRAWNRISIVIAWLAVVGLALGVDRLATGLRRRWSARRGRFVPLALAAVLVVVSFADQGGRDTPAYGENHLTYASDSAFFATVRTRLGAQAAVFNLPYEAFPEVPPRQTMGAYDEAIGYIYEPSLRWSFGAMRGRVPDYQAVLETQPTQQWLTSVVAIGFAGIVIDRHGYTDAERSVEEAQITALAGAPVVSADGRYSFYDLRGFATAARTQLGDAGIAARAQATVAMRSSPAGG